MNWINLTLNSLLDFFSYYIHITFMGIILKLILIIFVAELTYSCEQNSPSDSEIIVYTPAGETIAAPLLGAVAELKEYLGNHYTQPFAIVSSACERLKDSVKTEL